MDYKYIEQLLERYWECETSLEEEHILRTFFSQKDVPARLLPYQALFAYEQAERQDCKLGDDFDQKLLELTGEAAPVKARVITMKQRLMPLFKAAAIVAIILTLGNAMQMPFQQDVTPVQTAETVRPTEGPSVAVIKTDTVSMDSINQHAAQQPPSLIK